jgi:hypothetical protein
MSCRKCGKTVHECNSCKGGSARGAFGNKLTCSKCNNTGYLCGSHAGNWK